MVVAWTHTHTMPHQPLGDIIINLNLRTYVIGLSHLIVQLIPKHVTAVVKFYTTHYRHLVHYIAVNGHTASYRPSYVLVRQVTPGAADIVHVQPEYLYDVPRVPKRESQSPRGWCNGKYVCHPPKTYLALPYENQRSASSCLTQHKQVLVSANMGKKRRFRGKNGDAKRGEKGSV